MKGFSLSRITKSQSVRKLLGNFTYLTILQFAGYIFPLITIPYLARVIGVDGFGRIAFASSVIVWFQTIVDWGFNYSATREVARNKDNNNALSCILSTVLLAKCYLMLAAFVFLLFLSIVIPAFFKSRVLLCFTFLLIPGHVFFPDWFFQGLQRMKYLTIFNLISKTIFTLLVFVVVRKADDYLYQPILISAGYLLAGIISLYVIIFRWKIKLCFQPLERVLAAIKDSTNIFLNQIIPNIYNSFSIILLGILCGNIANGFFDAGRKIALVVQQFLSNIPRTFFPFLANNIKYHSLYALVSVLLGVLFAMINCALARPIILIMFSDKFLPSLPVVWISSITIVFNVMYQVYGTTYMILEGFEKQLRNITFCGALIGFLLSYPFIVNYGFIGAAIVILLANIILGVGTMLFVQFKKNR